MSLDQYLFVHNNKIMAGAHLTKDAVQAATVAGVQRPRDVARGGQQILLAFAAHAALCAVNEGIERAPDALQEDVMPVQVLPCTALSMAACILW